MIAATTPAMVFIDVETTGLNPVDCRVIEIAAIRVQDGVITDELNTLLNPGCDIPEFITDITGITTEDVADKPKFVDVIGELDSVLTDAMFVAHNAKFDYDFVAEEYNRERELFDVDDYYCTMRLSKFFYPQEIGHKLANIIERYNLKAGNSHRAYDDAHALYQFVEYLKKRFGDGPVIRALEGQV